MGEPPLFPSSEHAQTLLRGVMCLGDQTHAALHRNKLLVTGESLRLPFSTAHAVSAGVVRLSQIMQKDFEKL